MACIFSEEVKEASITDSQLLVPLSMYLLAWDEGWMGDYSETSRLVDMVMIGVRFCLNEFCHAG